MMRAARPLPSDTSHKLIIYVAPTPVFARLNGLDDRVIRCMEMFRRVFVLRGVAAADMPTFQAEPQVDPSIPRLQAVLTALGAGSNSAYLVEMCALSRHDCVSFPFTGR